MSKKLKALIIADCICVAFLLFFIFSLPRQLFISPTSFVVEASNGELLSAAIAKDGQWRFPVSDTVPEKFVKCITTFEDRRFFMHFGVDPVAMARAMRQNIKAKSVVSGGST
ncbi:MAG: penicillin-binding protein 1C, partial [Flavobacteriales bacterium]